MTARHDNIGGRRLDAWSRRRAAVRAEAEAEARDVSEREAALARAALADKSDAEALAALELPDPDGLAAGDDFAAFMRAAVPEHLRRRALRRLWLSDPMLANLDDLLDYGEDYTLKPGVIETVRSAYKVGRGFLEADEGAPAAASNAATAAAADAGIAPGIEAEAEKAPKVAAFTTVTSDIRTAPEQTAPEAVAGAPERAAAGPRRRMVFDFEGPGYDGPGAETAPTPGLITNPEVDRA